VYFKKLAEDSLESTMTANLPRISLPKAWPFCWWVAITVDHYSRRVMGFAVFNRNPNAESVRAFLGRTIHANQATPKYIISDKGAEFVRNTGTLWHGQTNHMFTSSYIKLRLRLFMQESVDQHTRCGSAPGTWASRQPSLRRRRRATPPRSRTLSSRLASFS
jgi:hypothetical protein